MSIEMSSDRLVCYKCGTTYAKRQGNFYVSYAMLYKGSGYIPICKDCIETMYNAYLAQCGDAKYAVRQMCRKLDLFWNETVYKNVEKKSTPKTVMAQYIIRINSGTFAGKSYDDSLSADGTLWYFAENDTICSRKVQEKKEENEDDEDIVVDEEVAAFWGPGYTPQMYMELEQRKAYWMSRLPDDIEMDIGAEAIIRQICSLEIDINKDRAAGRSFDKKVNMLNTLLGSANLKPRQRKQDEADLALSSTPMGVWLYRYENLRPLPEIDEDMKDVNGIKRYVFTWMGHLCKMLGLKNQYSQLYDEEIERLRVEKPEYDGDDDELFISSITEDGGQ